MTAQDKASLEAFDDLRKRLRAEAEQQRHVADEAIRHLWAAQDEKAIAERRAMRLMILCGLLAVLALWGWTR